MIRVSLKKCACTVISAAILSSAFAAMPITSSDVYAVTAAPAGVQLVEYSTTAAKIKWTKSTDVSGYFVYCSTDGKNFSKIKTLSSNYYAYSNLNLSPGKTYYFAVSSYKTVNGKNSESARSSVVKVKTTDSSSLPSPKNLKVTSCTDTAVSLSWDSVSNATNYYLYRSTDGKSYARIRSLSASAKTYKDTNLTAGKKYYYTISSCKMSNGATGIGPKTSAVSMTTTNTPLNITGTTSTDSTIKLSWKQLSSTARYQIYKYDNSKKTYVYSSVVSAPNNSWTDKNLKTDTEYKYMLRGYSSYNGVTKFFPYTYVTARTLAAAPSNVKLGSCSSNTINISWSKVSAAAGYNIYRSTDNKTFTKIKSLNSANTLTYRDTNLSSGKTFYYAVEFYKVVNGKTILSARSKSLKAQTTSASSMPAPSNIKPTQSSANSITLSWNSVPNVSGYYIYRSTNGKNYSKINTLSQGITTYIDKGLSSGVTYYYKIYSYKSSNGRTVIGPPSSVIAQKTTALVGNLTGVRSEAFNNLSIKVSWNKASNAVGYQVYMQKQGENYKLIYTAGANETSHTINSLGGNRTYYFKVRAVYNVNGNTTYSGFGTTVATTPSALDTVTLANHLCERINAEREKKGLKRLIRDDDVDKVALIRAQEISVKFSNTRPNGGSWTSALNQAGLQYFFCGENIANGYTNINMVVDVWMTRETESENIFNNRYSSIGIGVYYSNGCPYYDVIFYRPM